MKFVNKILELNYCSNKKYSNDNFVIENLEKKFFDLTKNCKSEINNSSINEKEDKKSHFFRHCKKLFNFYGGFESSFTI